MNLHASFKFENTMNLLLKSLIVVLIGISSVIAGTVLYVAEEMGTRPEFLTLQDKNLENKIEKAIKEKSVGDSIKISEFTEFEWDSLYVIEPYSLQSAIDNTGIDLSETRYNTGIEYHDAPSVIAFVKGDSLVRYAQPSFLGDGWTINEKTFEITMNPE